MSLPKPPADRLALIKKLATRKKRKVGDNTSVNRLLKQVEEYSKSAPTRTPL